ncbi:hypothetical protein Q5705_08310 [Kosakonia sp. H02]|nr:hypothetical protein Q5705_08310 [Kosakonia sp. H02]
MAWTDAIRDIDSGHRQRSSQYCPWDYASREYICALLNTMGNDPEQ